MWTGAQVMRLRALTLFNKISAENGRESAQGLRSGATDKLKHRVLLSLLALMLSACGLGTTPDDTALAQCNIVEDGAVAFIKRPLLSLEDDDGSLATDDLRDPQAFRGGARLFLKSSTLASASAVDITSSVFSDPSFLDDDGQLVYDVKDLAVSPSGRQLLFAMRAPQLEDDEVDQPKWNIWLYDLDSCDLTRVISQDATAETGHDMAPAFLADGRIVFSSTRQQTSRAILLDEGLSPQYSGLEEDRNVEAFNLHVMDNTGQNIEQITFNQSHDLDPLVRPDGKILFSRWDNAGQTPNNGFNLYEVNPDGTELDYVFGRHSHDSGDDGSVVHYANAILSDMDEVVVNLREFEAPLLNTVPTVVDVDLFIEADLDTNGIAGIGQSRLISGLSTSDEPSLDGVYGSVFPLYDGTGRLLVSWSFCRVRERLPDDAPNGTENTNPAILCTADNIANTATYEAAPPAFGLWIYDNGSQQPIELPEEGVAFEEAVLMTETAEPTFIPPVVLSGDDLDLANNGYGALHIRSVYDFDGVDQSGVGIDVLADPVQTAPADRPIQFLRLEKAVSIPSDDVRDFRNTAFGRSANQSMRQILGYVPVEPDGSVKVAVPANVPIAISLLDREGRRLRTVQRHQNWISVRLGETRECIGCHTSASEVPHARLNAGPDAVNQGATTTGIPFPNTDPALFADAGETMAEVYERINGIRQLTADIEYEDVWTDTGITPAAASFEYLYSDLETTAPYSASNCATVFSSLCRIVINYVEHIHPLWSVDRQVLDVDGITVLQDNTCTACHTNTDDMGAAMVPEAQLDLTDGASDQQADHFKSYRELLFNDSQQIVQDGILVNELQETGNLVPADPPEFETDGDGELILDIDGNPIPILVPELEEINIPPTLNVNGARFSENFFSLFEVGGSHADYLSPAELKLLSEWVDIGAQYYNDPFKAPEN